MWFSFLFIFTSFSHKSFEISKEGNWFSLNPINLCSLQNKGTERSVYLDESKNIKGSSGIRTRDLAHPKRESYP